MSSIRAILEVKPIGNSPGACKLCDFLKTLSDQEASDYEEALARTRIGSPSIADALYQDFGFRVGVSTIKNCRKRHNRNTRLEA